ncbi:MAG: hypothetical protein HKN94_08685 [Acidimicrobiales bacterium]|nr:hypothetical protein [Acidimicrobiales bacterium]
MGYEQSVQRQMLAILDLVAPLVPDPKTHSKVRKLIADRSRWGEAHDANQRLQRQQSHRTGEGHQHQYSFLSICLQTLYNETDTAWNGSGMPHFDVITPFYVIPIALGLAKHLGLPETAIQECLAAS